MAGLVVEAGLNAEHRALVQGLDALNPREDPRLVPRRTARDPRRGRRDRRNISEARGAGRNSRARAALAPLGAGRGPLHWSGPRADTPPELEALGSQRP